MARRRVGSGDKKAGVGKLSHDQRQNMKGEPTFSAQDGTPAVNGLSQGLLSPNNPNIEQPFRLNRAEAYTCSQDHNYTDEQKAYDGGLMDKFVQSTAHLGLGCRTDGSTVTPSAPQMRSRCARMTPGGISRNG